MSAPALRLTRVTRWYGPVAGLLEVDLTLGPGVFGLLGPNGAGKSTILHLAAGLIRPGMGRVEVFGDPPFHSGRARGRLGLLPETEAFPPGVSARTFLDACLILSGVPGREARRRAEELLERGGLREAAARKVAGYSQGMKQRLKLAQALGHQPDLLLLDEPLTGLDPLARRRVIELVAEQGRAGKTVLVSSHVLHEVESMTSSVILLHQGRVLAEGGIQEIREHLTDRPVKVRIGSGRARELAGMLLASPAVAAVRMEPGALEVEALDADRFFEELGGLAAQGAIEVQDLRVLDENLEAVFDYLVR